MIINYISCNLSVYFAALLLIIIICYSISEQNLVL